MKTEATITEHGKYLLNSHTTDVHYREFLRYFTKVSEYWLKLKEVKVDLTGKMNGHGAYIKKDKEVILKAKKNKALEKYLEVSISDETYDEMLNLVEE